MSIKIKKDDLENRYKSTSAIQLAGELGICIATLYIMLKKAGIPLKGRQGRGREPKFKVV